METIQLNAETSLSRVVQGYWRLTAWDWDEKQLARHMNECIEHGVTSFDTAEVYGAGECEAQIGRALAYDRTLRKKIQLVTKTGIVPQGEGVPASYYDTTYRRVVEGCKKSLRRLQSSAAPYALNTLTRACSTCCANCASIP